MSAASRLEVPAGVPGHGAAIAAAPELATRILGVEEMRAEVAGWRDLFHGCAEANPFYGPDFLLPLLALDARLMRLRFVLVSLGKKPVALCPVLPHGFAWPRFGRRIAMAGHEFIFNSLPLLRRGFETSGWRAVLAALHDEHGRGVLTIAASPLDGPSGEGLMTLLAEGGRAGLVAERRERVGIVAPLRLEAQLARVKGRTLGKLRRHARDLAKLGEIGFRTATSGPALAEALAAFMALEARGWKGRQGSAFASDPRLTAFADEALASGGGAPGVRIELMTLDGRAIGGCLHLVAQGCAATFKIAYDEELARHAPGVLTMQRSLEALCGEPWTRRLDAGVEPEHAVGVIWRDRLATGEILVALSPRQSEAELRLYAKAIALRQAVRARLRDAYYAITGRKRTRGRKAAA